jgi:hypothetical protein
MILDLPPGVSEAQFIEDCGEFDGGEWSKVLDLCLRQIQSNFEKALERLQAPYRNVVGPVDYYDVNFEAALKKIKSDRDRATDRLFGLMQRLGNRGNGQAAGDENSSVSETPSGNPSEPAQGGPDGPLAGPYPVRRRLTVATTGEA